MPTPMAPIDPQPSPAPACRPSPRRAPPFSGRWLVAVAVGVALAAPTSVPAVFDADPLLSGSAEAAGFIADPPIAVRVD